MTASYFGNIKAYIPYLGSDGETPDVQHLHHVNENRIYTVWSLLVLLPGLYIQCDSIGDTFPRQYISPLQREIFLLRPEKFGSLG